MTGRWHGGTVSWLAIALLGFVAAGCSKKEATARGPAKGPEVDTIVTAPWGSSPGQLGRSIPEEGSPEAVKSFVVDADGTIHVLDAVNRRIESFVDGKSTGTLKVPDRPFEDIELDSGGFLLLDLFQKPGVVGLGLDGTVSGELALPADDVPEPGLVTALSRSASGTWVTVEQELMVQVADPQGNPVEPRVVPGQLFDGDAVFRAEPEQRSVAVYQQPSMDAAPELFAKIEFNQDLRGVSLLERGSSNRVFLVVLTEHAQPDPETPPKQEHVFVELSSSGQELRRATLPADTGAFEVFRSVRLGADGNVYVLTTKGDGVEIVKVTP